MLYQIRWSKPSTGMMAERDEYSTSWDDRSNRVAGTQHEGGAGEYMWGPPGIQISFIWGNQTVEASATVQRDLRIMEDWQCISARPLLAEPIDIPNLKDASENQQSYCGLSTLSTQAALIDSVQHFLRRPRYWVEGHYSWLPQYRPDVCCIADLDLSTTSENLSHPSMPNNIKQCGRPILPCYVLSDQQKQYTPPCQTRFQKLPTKHTTHTTS